MAGFLNEIAPTLTFPTDERKVRRGAVVLVNWRINGLLIARLKLREAMNIGFGFTGLELRIQFQLSKVMDGWVQINWQISVFLQPVNLVM